MEAISGKQGIILSLDGYFLGFHRKFDKEIGGYSNNKLLSTDATFGFCQLC